MAVWSHARLERLPQMKIHRKQAQHTQSSTQSACKQTRPCAAAANLVRMPARQRARSAKTGPLSPAGSLTKRNRTAEQLQRAVEESNSASDSGSGSGGSSSSEASVAQADLSDPALTLEERQLLAQTLTRRRMKASQYADDHTLTANQVRREGDCQPVRRSNQLCMQALRAYGLQATMLRPLLQKPRTGPGVASAPCAIWC